jgi:hypothetical protein
VVPAYTPRYSLRFRRRSEAMAGQAPRWRSKVMVEVARSRVGLADSANLGLRDSTPLALSVWRAWRGILLIEVCEKDSAIRTHRLEPEKLLLDGCTRGFVDAIRVGSETGAPGFWPWYGSFVPVFICPFSLLHVWL